MRLGRHRGRAPSRGDQQWTPPPRLRQSNWTVVYDNPNDFPKLETLVDTFDGSSLDGPVTNSYGTFSVHDGFVEFTSSAAGVGVGDFSAYDTSVVVEFEAATDGFIYWKVQASPTGATRGFTLAGSGSGRQLFFDGIVTPVTYDPVNHRFIRQTFSAELMIWHTSPNGIDWTLQGSAPVQPGFYQPKTFVEFGVGTITSGVTKLHGINALAAATRLAMLI